MIPQGLQSTAGARAFTSLRLQRPAARRASVACCAELSPGTKVKVKDPMTVYHVPGFKSGLEIQGWEGEIVQNVVDFKGKSLSPNYPWKVQFEVENKGKTKKFFCHLGEDELEAA